MAYPLAGLLLHPNRPALRPVSYSEVVGGFSVKSPQSDELKDFLLSRQQHASADEIDWDERRRQCDHLLERRGAAAER
jgi:hypothetical protein